MTARIMRYKVILAIVGIAALVLTLGFAQHVSAISSRAVRWRW